MSKSFAMADVPGGASSVALNSPRRIRTFPKRGACCFSETIGAGVLMACLGLLGFDASERAGSGHQRVMRRLPGGAPGGIARCGARFYTTGNPPILFDDVEGPNGV
jgi:hypothetical protein